MDPLSDGVLPEQQHLANRVFALRNQLSEAETLVHVLKLQLQEAEQDAEAARYAHQANGSARTPPPTHAQQPYAVTTNSPSLEPSSSKAAPTATATSSRWPLSPEEYSRYGRQLILPEIGIRGQLCLKNARVCIVGVGGLGCPAATYLAGSGVKSLGLVDGDTVEISNLHRQIAHSSNRVGWMKVQSACSSLKQLNPLVEYVAHTAHLTPESALDIFAAYDIVLDCTDHPSSRYLISDACVLAGKPLVSASALKTEGQLIVLNNPPSPPGDLNGGPCYRCIFPRPPPPESLQSCGEGGILGPVVGTMGVLQALEAIKVLTGPLSNYSNSAAVDTRSEPAPVKPTLLMFSAYSQPQFRSVRMRSRRPDCAVCSTKASITRDTLQSGTLDYIAFCGTVPAVDLLPPSLRVNAKQFAEGSHSQDQTIIDVRDATHFDISALDRSVNVPWIGNAESWLQNVNEKGFLGGDVTGDCYVVCRLGNDSQLAAKALIDSGKIQGSVRDIKGGLAAWRREVDPTWPDY